MMRGTSRGSLRTSTTSPASTATSVPAPMAMPTSAVRRAGASFTPSPTIATRAPRRRPPLASALPLLALRRLLLRQDLGEDGVDAELLGHRAGHRLRIAGHHDHLDALRVEPLHRPGGPPAARARHPRHPAGR